MKKKTVLSGIIRMHPRGFGFVTPHKGAPLTEDVFIPKRKTLHAVEGDEVEISYSHGWSGKGPEGEVLAILRRSRRHVAGTLAEELGKGLFSAYIPLFGPEKEMVVSTPPRSKVGDRMIIEVTNWGGPKKAAKGKFIASLGHISDGSADIKAAVEEFELIDTFSCKVEKEVAAFGKSVSTKEIEGRKDFTKLETFTIDPDQSKDFDDALTLTTSDKGYTLYVHIADVSAYVKPKSALDKEAYARCNSVYFPGGVLPMLPPALSNNLCSLKPNVRRLAVSVIIALNKRGELIDYKIVRSVIKSDKRFTYNEAKRVLEGKEKSPHKKTLQEMVKLCRLFKEQRTKRGAVEFAMPDLELVINKKGEISKMKIVEYDITHQMVEEFMLKANELVALTLSKENKPLTYRIHEEPNAEKMRDFALYAKSFGFKISQNPTSEELQELFDKTRESSFGKCLTTAFIRTMKLANYSTQNIGHYGLMLEHYTHFTSPIRRYVDLIVHRLLFNDSDAKLDHEKMALQCSEKERSSAKAEGSVTKLKKLRHLEKLFTKDPDAVFDAVVTYVKSFGIAFEIKGLFMEGFISTHDLGHSFVFHKKGSKLTSQRQQFFSGAPLQVQVVDVDLITREAFFKLPQKKSSGKKKRLK